MLSIGKSAGGFTEKAFWLPTPPWRRSDLCPTNLGDSESPCPVWGSELRWDSSRPSRSCWSPSKTHFSTCIQGCGSGPSCPFPSVLLPAPAICHPFIFHACPGLLSSHTFVQACPSFHYCLPEPAALPVWVTSPAPLLFLGTCPLHNSSPGQRLLGKAHARGWEARWEIRNSGIRGIC